MVRFKDMQPRPKPAADVLPPEVVDFLTADANYSFMAPKMEGQSIIQRYAALSGGDAGDAISISLAVCSPGRGPALHAHLNTVVAPLNTLREKELCPGAKALADVNESYR